MRSNSQLSQAESEMVLRRTDKFKTGGTFFFTADPDVVQVYPDKKLDRRIIQMY